jgi:hypothetical protein
LDGVEVRVDSTRQDSGHTTKCDSHGRCELSGISPGRWRLEVHKGFFATSILLDVAKGRVTEAHVVIPRGGRVEGEVRHVTLGPLGGVTLVFLRQTSLGNQRLTVRTNELGHYRIAGAPEGTYSVSLSGKQIGYVPYGRFHVEVRRRGTTRSVFELGHVSLSGTVTDASTGKPLAGVRISLQEPISGVSVTNADGAYRFTDLPDGDYVLRAEKNRYERQFVDVRGVERARPSTRDFTLTAAAVIHIRVTDSKAQPAIGKFVLRVERGRSLTTLEIVTDETGHAMVRQFGPGTYRLSLADAGGSGPDIVTRIQPGANTVHLRVPGVPERLGRERPPSLHGIVCDSRTKKPLPAARIRVLRPKKREAYTNAQGAYHLDGLPAGAYALLVEKDGFATRPFRDVAVEERGAHVFNVELDPATALVITITDGSGKPIQGEVLLVRFYDEVGGVGELVHADDKGRVLYRRLPPGHCRLELMARDVGQAVVDQKLVLGKNTVAVTLR